MTTGEKTGTEFTLPKINWKHSSNEDCPFTFYRFQFPVRVAFCITINKSQGQSFSAVGVILPASVFAHGQLYVALSRCTSAAGTSLSMTMQGGDLSTLNIVFKPILLL